LNNIISLRLRLISAQGWERSRRSNITLARHVRRGELRSRGARNPPTTPMKTRPTHFILRYVPMFGRQFDIRDGVRAGARGIDERR
jgi:hypothetical protein